MTKADDLLTSRDHEGAHPPSRFADSTLRALANSASAVSHQGVSGMKAPISICRVSLWLLAATLCMLSPQNAPAQGKPEPKLEDLVKFKVRVEPEDP
ncbi:MAG TPA: hypothetical protein VFE62_10270, partial [Gemmataceae bacterium]|nr:hypothetical protein [Gemmataceae bacterium]